MEKGLSESSVATERSRFGYNEIIVEKPFSALKLFLSQFPNLINAVLFIAAVFSFAVQDYIDGSFILAVLILNSTIGFIQEYRAEKSLEKLKNLITPLCRVIRDGKEQQIQTRDIVPNDIVVVSEGERIPADGEIIDAKHIEIDESILTGESLPIVKNKKDKVYSGTLVTKGHCVMKVTTIGMQTRFGQIAETLSSIKPDKTPLQIRLSELGRLISLIAFGIALFIIPIGLFRNYEPVSLIFIAVSAGIAAIPEGLPAVVTVALAIGTNRMARKKAIVRKMPVIETLGAMQILLIDKTGTLTKNAMRVKKYWTMDKNSFEMLLQACILGNTASLVEKADTKTWETLGDKTDGALLLFAREHIPDINAAKKEGTIIEEYVFDPEEKTVTTEWEKNGKKRVFVRGAPEIILEKTVLTNEEKANITKLFDEYAKEGYRVIGFGTKTEDHTITSRQHLENHLTFLGFVGIYDPPRDEAQHAVEEARKAGIHTIMVTGDNELTALTIAKEVGLIKEDEDVITGDELAKIQDNELTSIIMKTRIFARTNPEDKLRLAEILKKMGYIVGVTGDGVNDALALKRADVGIAMGQEGTDVAKEASDIVLTDDNFATLVKAVEEGRTIYKNIITAITYLLIGNLSELSFILLSAASGLTTPFYATQILWINLITDGLPALALASDTKDPSVLKENPRDPKTPLLDHKRIVYIVLVGIGMGVSLVITFGLLLRTESVLSSRTFVFNLLLFFHLVLVLAIRGKSPFSMNRFLLTTIIVSILAQIGANTFPFFKQAFEI